MNNADEDEVSPFNKNWIIISSDSYIHILLEYINISSNET